MADVTQTIEGSGPLPMFHRTVPLVWQTGIGALCGIAALLAAQLPAWPADALWRLMPIELLAVIVAGCAAGLFASLTATAIILVYYIRVFSTAAPSMLTHDMAWLPLLAIVMVATAGITGWLRDSLGRTERELSGTRTLLQGTNHRLEAALEADRKRAYYDPLTDLPSRRLVTDRFIQVVSQARRGETLLALLLLDLNRFKEVNETFGHDVGDEVLRQVGQRLSGVMRREDTVGRLDGNTFIVLLTGLAEEGGVTVATQKIAGTLAPPFAVGTPPRQIHISASLGGALFPADGEDWESLYRYAEESLHLAKRPA